MKNSRIATLLPLMLAALATTARAAITILGANGSDGALNITTDTVIDLSQAVTDEWDSNNAAHAGKGVYDPAKWAVVFKYTDVNIASNATVTFKNHASRAPVVWLVSGNAEIGGTLSLDGQPGQPPPYLAEPGPGGFRGGAGDYLGLVRGSGFGPGGGLGGFVGFTQIDSFYASGGYASSGATWGLSPSSTYGNPSIIPLIGGSGGGGAAPGWTGIHAGGGGGGALLLAVRGSVTVDGTIRAIGGNPLNQNSGGGSGGAIRIVTGTLAGTGSILATGSSINAGGLGRIRLERTNTITSESFIVQPGPSTIDITSNATALIWPPSGSPEVRIVSIGTGIVPPDPRAAFGAFGPDVAVPLTPSTLVRIETTNVEEAAQVIVRGTPQINGNFTETNAVIDTVVSNDPLVIRWVADLPVNAGYSAVQVKVVRP